jgi:hypothetical protein
MVADIKSERWPASNRNRWPDCVGIRTVIKAKRGVIFFEVKPSDVDDWRIVTAVNVVAIDDDTLPWPALVDPRKRHRREGRDGLIAADGAVPDGSLDKNALPTGMSVPPPPLPAPEAEEEPKPIVASEASISMASATARSMGPNASVGGGKAGTSGMSRSAQVRATTSTKSLPPSKAATTKYSVAAKGVSPARQIVVMDTGAYSRTNPPVTKGPKR